MSIHSIPKKSRKRSANNRIYTSPTHVDLAFHSVTYTEPEKKEKKNDSTHGFV